VRSLSGPPTRSSRNLWAVSVASFFMDISSEMILNLVPLLLSNVLGARTVVIGLVEGVGDATANLLQVGSGWVSDRLRARKWLAVAGYALSAVSKPIFYMANTWAIVLVVRWLDRVGKGVRTAPRDALIADSTDHDRHGRAFGFQRAADTAGAVVGLAIALAVVVATGVSSQLLGRSEFQVIALLSVVPAALAVVSLALGARDVPRAARHEPISPGRLGRPFFVFLGVVTLFGVGNSSDAFLVLRAQERGLRVADILVVLIVFNLVYALISTPAGALSDRIGRQRLIIVGWFMYAGVYLGFAFARAPWHIWVLYVLYGAYYGLTYGVLKALVADVVPAELRGTAYGAYNTTVAMANLAASLIAGVLWQGLGAWPGFGPAAPFVFGGTLALLAAVLLSLWAPTAPCLLAPDVHSPGARGD
jgi:MFS family permease